MVCFQSFETKNSCSVQMDNERDIPTLTLAIQAKADARILHLFRTSTKLDFSISKKNSILFEYCDQNGPLDAIEYLLKEIKMNPNESVTTKNGKKQSLVDYCITTSRISPKVLKLLFQYGGKPVTERQTALIRKIGSIW